MIAGLGLVRARGRPGGQIGDAYAVAARCDTDMSLFAEVITDLANGQVATGQAEVGFYDMLGALWIRGGCSATDAQRNLDVISACRAYGQRIRFNADPMAINRLLGPACRSKLGIRAVRTHPGPVSVEILQEELAVISEHDQPLASRGLGLHSVHFNSVRVGPLRAYDRGRATSAAGPHNPPRATTAALGSALFCCRQGALALGRRPSLLVAQERSCHAADRLVGSLGG
jgi:hypothetical protein